MYKGEIGPNTFNDTAQCLALALRLQCLDLVGELEKKLIEKVDELHHDVDSKYREKRSGRNIGLTLTMVVLRIRRRRWRCMKFYERPDGSSVQARRPANDNIPMSFHEAQGFAMEGLWDPLGMEEAVGVDKWMGATIYLDVKVLKSQCICFNDEYEKRIVMPLEVLYCEPRFIV